MLELSRLRSLLRGKAPCRTFPGPQYTAPLPCTAPLPYAAPYVTMPAMSARPALSMGYYGQGSQVPFVPNPNWMTERQQLLQQLLQERQQFEAWRASQTQANPQPQPQITSAGPVQVEGDVDFSKRSASATRARPEDQITSKAASTSRRLPSPKRDYPGGLAQPLGHLRPVPNGLSVR